MINCFSFPSVPTTSRLLKSLISESFVYLESPYTRYRIEIADSPIGVVTRLDNFINDFSKHLDELRQSIKDCEQFVTTALNELAKKDMYASKIENLENRLNELDKILGVNKNETTN